MIKVGKVSQSTIKKFEFLLKEKRATIRLIKLLEYKFDETEFLELIENLGKQEISFRTEIQNVGSSYELPYTTFSINSFGEVFIKFL